MHALVTGANRGLGLEVCRQLRARGLDVVLTARDARRGARAAAEVGARFEVLDVASRDAVDACAQRLRAAGVHIDVLVNNAGVYPEGSALDATLDAWTAAMDINFAGALWTCRAFLPAMLARGYGRVVNVTSGYGSFGEGLDGAAPYSVSKAALNALTLKLAQEARGDVKVNAVCPGWVRTRMGGADAELPVEEGAAGIVWAATLPAGGPSGGNFRHGQPIPW